ncbi:hypothetical protein ACFZDK_13065 [Streptomyces sp. NPDC007901]|uniref:hypothetical protein n=1 Tax=Streptomyces sp. NPDC007901 TaxID=3364785 RepID=UPI0036E625A1
MSSSPFQMQSGGQSSTSLLAFLLVMLAGPVAALVLAAAIVMFDPGVVLGQRDWQQTESHPQPAPSRGFMSRAPPARRAVPR